MKLYAEYDFQVSTYYKYATIFKYLKVDKAQPHTHLNELELWLQHKGYEDGNLTL